MATVWLNNVEYTIHYDGDTKHQILVEKPTCKHSTTITVSDIDRYHISVNDGTLQLTSVFVYNIPNIADYTQEIDNNVLILHMKKKPVDIYVTEDELYTYDLRHAFITQCTVFDKMQNVVSRNRKDYTAILNDLVAHFDTPFVIRTKIVVRYFMNMIKKFECAIQISFTLKNDNVLHFTTPAGISN
jgi:hypothetical protein